MSDPVQDDPDPTSYNDTLALLFFVVAAELFALGHGFGHVFAVGLLFQVLRNIINGVFPVVKLLVFFLLKDQVC